MKVAVALTVTVLLAFPSTVHSQLVPSDRWYTIETKHFRIHFTKPLEAEGKRGAVDAERAWAELSTELRPPRGKVDLVIADNIDYVNGYATPFPGNRVVVFAHPPVDAPELRNYGDWLRLGITHELTHIFHLDRGDGLWRLGRDVFGRHPAFFPNAYLPSWLVEGLAVYYESRLTGAGRLEGSEHFMLARAAAEARQVPRIGELSRATTKFPGGETVYAYGSLILDYLSRTRGADKIGKFVDETSRVILPLSLNAKAKSIFGISFENAWRDWRDSVVRTSHHREPVPQWRDLTREGRYVESPRWIGDTAIMYSAATGKDVPGAYVVDLVGNVSRIGRRNSLDANVRLPDGSIVFAQPDYIDPFHYRNDLYVQRGAQQTRLTRGARVSQPDARPDGEIVAVQSIPGSTRLVRVSHGGRLLRPITSGTDSVQWAEPRWSPDGRLVAAVRIRGLISEIVVLDSAGGGEKVVTRARAIVATPSWSAGGDTILYASNELGSQGPMEGYAVEWTGPPRIQIHLTEASTGFFAPELSPNGKLLAGLSFRFDGYHVGIGPLMPEPQSFYEEGYPPPPPCRTCIETRTEIPLALEDVPKRKRYSPWRSLLPTYWEPIVTQSTGNGTALGAATSGYDVIGRHAFYAQAAYNTKFKETEAFAAYQYAGLGQPYLNFTAEQAWEHFGLFNSAGRVGDLTRRARIGGVSATLVRPRARTYAAVSFGGELESRVYTTQPDTLLSLLPPVFGRARSYPSLFVSPSWGNTKRPSLSISPEDGFTVSATARQRWQSGDFATASRSIVGVTAAYKSLDLPGFAHHVVALRAAGGYADDRAISSFSVGGLSGGSLDVLAGVAVGGERRTFGVRGFPPSAEQGIRALAGSAEYRAPLAAPSRRVPFIPLLFDRISFAAFADAGRAFCPTSANAAEACRSARANSPWLASAGGEVDFDTAVQYDVPARFRIGVAVPVLDREAIGAKKASLYLTLGSSF